MFRGMRVMVKEGLEKKGSDCFAKEIHWIVECPLEVM